MAREFTFLDDDGFPVEPFAVGIDTHSAFHDAAEEHELTRVGKLREYYEDAEVPPRDLPELIHELLVIENSIRVEGSVRHVAAGIRAVAEAALTANKSLHALAD